MSGGGYVQGVGTYPTHFFIVFDSKGNNLSNTRIIFILRSILVGLDGREVYFSLTCKQIKFPLLGII